MNDVRSRDAPEPSSLPPDAVNRLLATFDAQDREDRARRAIMQWAVWSLVVAAGAVLVWYWRHR